MLVFDGGGGFCKDCVRFYERRARPSAPVAVSHQATTVPEGFDPLSSVLLIRERGTLDESAAVVRILWSMRALWPLVGAVLWSVPKPVRDAAYRWVARNRHRL